MPLIWFYHYKMGKRVYIKIPDDVWPDKFKRSAEIITRYHEKITDHFGVNQVAKEVGVKYETAKRYLEILKDYGIVKQSPTLREDSYILACTPKEEAQAKSESNASQLAARGFTLIKRTAQNWPGIAESIQRRRTIFNERLNFWFLGDLPPLGPPFPPISPDSAIELTLRTREKQCKASGNKRIFREKPIRTWSKSRRTIFLKEPILARLNDADNIAERAKRLLRNVC